MLLPRQTALLMGLCRDHLFQPKKIVHFCANKDVNLFAYGTCSSAIAILCLNNALQNGVETSDEKM